MKPRDCKHPQVLCEKWCFDYKTCIHHQGKTMPTTSVTKEELVTKTSELPASPLSGFESIILTALQEKMQGKVLDFQASELLKGALRSAEVRIDLQECY